jgi:hypothetical protein
MKPPKRPLTFVVAFVLCILALWALGWLLVMGTHPFMKL